MKVDKVPIYAVVRKPHSLGVVQDRRGGDGSTPPIRSEFLVSFLVDKRGGALTGSRGSGIRLIVPPGALEEPVRVQCAYVKPVAGELPPLLDGDAMASSGIIHFECSPTSNKPTHLQKPILMEIPHFCDTETGRRELVVIKSSDGITWSEHAQFHAGPTGWSHTNEEELYMDIVSQLKLNQVKEDLDTDRIVRISLESFSKYWAVVSRVPSIPITITPNQGGVLSHSRMSVIFPPAAVQKKIKAGLQVRPEGSDLGPCAHLWPAQAQWKASDLVGINPRGRRLHEPMAIKFPLGQWELHQAQGHVIHVMCSKAPSFAVPGWEDFTQYTTLQFVKGELLLFTRITGLYWLFCIPPSTPESEDIVGQVSRLYSLVARKNSSLCEMIVFYRAEFPRAWCHTFRIHLTTKRGWGQPDQGLAGPGEWRMCARKVLALEEGKYAFTVHGNLILVNVNQSQLTKRIDNTLVFEPCQDQSLVLVARKIDPSIGTAHLDLKVTHVETGTTVQSVALNNVE